MKLFTSLLVTVLACLLGPITPCSAFQFKDGVGDTRVADITGINYQVINGSLEMTISFVSIPGDTIVIIKLDSDRSMLTGFASGCGSKEFSRFGVDYIIRIETASMIGYDSAYLIYDRFTSATSVPFYEIEQKKIPIGHPFVANGTTYKKSRQQMYLKIPLTFFSNESYPLYSRYAAPCVKQLYPKPSTLVNNLAKAYVNVRTESMFYLGQYDQLPNSGMIDASTGTVAAAFPKTSSDVSGIVNDPANDSIMSGILSDEITALQYYFGKDMLTLILKLTNLEFSDLDQRYIVNLDLDNNPSTGLKVRNGSLTIGSDITADLSSWGLAPAVGFNYTPFASDLGFGADKNCALPYSHLSYAWPSRLDAYPPPPGYVGIAIPRPLMQRFLSSNKTGAIKVLGSSRQYYYPHDSRDVIPNTGCITIKIPAF